MARNGTFQLRRTHRAANRRTAQIARHLPHMGLWMLRVDRCMLHVACCMLHVACCVPSVSCRMFACCHRSNRFPHVRMRARNVQAQTHLSVWPMRWSGAAQAARAPTVNRPQLPRILCTAAAPHPKAAERCSVAARADGGHRQRCREGAVGGLDGEEHGCLVRRASAALQGTPSQMGTRIGHVVPAHVCSQLPYLTLSPVLPSFLSSLRHLRRTLRPCAHTRWLCSGVGLADSAAAAPFQRWQQRLDSNHRSPHHRSMSLNASPARWSGISTAAIAAQPVSPAI
jgi:hypothetical protein